MGIFSFEKIDSLFWLGRYSARTQDLIRLYMTSFDRMIDSDTECYKTLCVKLGIPDIFSGKDDFIRRFPFDKSLPFSIAASAAAAFSNAMTMREYIGSETLSYLQMVIYDLDEAGGHQKDPIFYLQHAVDYIYAFWGCLEDAVDDEMTRDIVKLGKNFERFDIDLRLSQPLPVLSKDFRRFENRLRKCDVDKNEEALSDLARQMNADIPDCPLALSTLHEVVIL